MNDEDAISAAKTEFREAYNTGNVERLLSVFADSFTDMSEGEPSFYGTEAKTALRWRSTNLFREYTTRMEVIIIAINIHGETAYDWGWHKMTLIPKSGGKLVVKRFRYCEVWQKNNAGKWQIRIFITNKDQEPQMLAESANALASSEPAAASIVR